MKTLTLSLLSTFCTLLSFGQNIASPPANLPAQTTSATQMYIGSDYAQSASIQHSQYDKVSFLNAYRERAEERCAHAKKIEIVGIVLASVGGAFIITGSVLIAVGVNQVNNSNNYYNYNGTGNFYTGPDGTAAIAGGVVCLLAGAGCAGAGIPLAIIGSVKSKKYCGGGRDRSYMELSTKGNGLALNF